MTAKVKFIGKRELILNLGKLTEETERRASKGLKVVGKLIKDDALKKVPVEDGFLRDSAYGGINYPVRKSGGIIYTKVGFDDTKAPHAKWVHEMPGTLKGKNKPRPSGKGVYWSPDGEPQFLLNAVTKNMGKIRRIIKGFLK